MSLPSFTLSPTLAHASNSHPSSSPRPYPIPDICPFWRQEEEDDDIVAGAARVSLQCPLSHLRVSTPVRSHRCKHLECFDLQSYLQMARGVRAMPLPPFSSPPTPSSLGCPA